MHVYVYVCMFVCMYVCTHAYSQNMRTYVYACTCTCVCVCLCVCVCTDNVFGNNVCPDDDQTVIWKNELTSSVEKTFIREKWVDGDTSKPLVNVYTASMINVYIVGQCLHCINGKCLHRWSMFTLQVTYRRAKKTIRT